MLCHRGGSGFDHPVGAMLLTTGATLVEFPTPDETVAAVQSGEVDAVLSDKDFLMPIVAETDLMFLGRGPYLGGGIGMAFREVG